MITAVCGTMFGHTVGVQSARPRSVSREHNTTKTHTYTIIKSQMGNRLASMEFRVWHKLKTAQTFYLRPLDWPPLIPLFRCRPIMWQGDGRKCDAWYSSRLHGAYYFDTKVLLTLGNSPKCIVLCAYKQTLTSTHTLALATLNPSVIPKIY